MKKYLLDDFNLDKYINFSDEISLWSAPFGIKLLETIDYRENISALDIGSGSGFPLIELAMRLGEGSIIYGIDPWKAAIKRTREKISYYRISNIRLIEGVAESIPLEDDSIDLIVSNNGINNVDNIDQVLNECSRIMKKEGQFVLTMNLTKTMIEFYSQLEQVLNEMNLRKEIELMHHHINEKRRSLEEVTSLLRKYGFDLRKLVQDQFFYKFTNGTAMLNHQFIRLAFLKSWKTFLPDNKLEGIFDEIETRMNEASRKAEGVTLTIPFAVIDAIKT